MFGVIDLFAGCGGLTAGFLGEGSLFTPLAAVEHDLAAAATYAVNFGEEHVHRMDIRRFEDVPRADVVVGGPPCQGFSNLGSKDPLDPRNALWREYVRVVLEADPKVFVLENVQRFQRTPEYALLLDALGGGALKRWKHVSADVLNAADFGVPQRRLRTIVIASRIGPVQLPRATHSRSGEEGRRPWRSVRSAIGRLPAEPRSNELPKRTIDLFDHTLPGPFTMAEIHLGRCPTPRSLERYAHVPPGGGRFDLPRALLPVCWANKPTGTTDVMGRLLWDQPSLTIRTEFFKPEKGRYLHPEWHPGDPARQVNRAITHREAAALQTFPNGFRWCGSKIDIARQIGNAVPVRLGAAIADVVGEALER